jgi:hypothetical protein
MYFFTQLTRKDGEQLRLVVVNETSDVKGTIANHPSYYLVRNFKNIDLTNGNIDKENVFFQRFERSMLQTNPIFEFLGVFDKLEVFGLDDDYKKQLSILYTNTVTMGGDDSSYIRRPQPQPNERIQPTTKPPVNYGIINEGNYCWLISSLQLLFAMTDLREAVLKDKDHFFLKCRYGIDDDKTMNYKDTAKVAILSKFLYHALNLMKGSARNRQYISIDNLEQVNDFEYVAYQSKPPINVVKNKVNLRRVAVKFMIDVGLTVDAMRELKERTKVKWELTDPRFNNIRNQTCNSLVTRQLFFGYALHDILAMFQPTEGGLRREDGLPTHCDISVDDRTSIYDLFKMKRKQFLIQIPIRLLDNLNGVRIPTNVTDDENIIRQISQNEIVKNALKVTYNDIMQSPVKNTDGFNTIVQANGVTFTTVLVQPLYDSFLRISCEENCKMVRRNGDNLEVDFIDNYIPISTNNHLQRFKNIINFLVVLEGKIQIERYDIPDFNKYLIIDIVRGNPMRSVKKQKFPFVCERYIQTENGRYVLIGKICHSGSNITGGHYVYNSYDEESGNFMHQYNDRYVDTEPSYQVNENCVAILYMRTELQPADDDLLPPQSPFHSPFHSPSPSPPPSPPHSPSPPPPLPSFKPPPFVSKTNFPFHILPESPMLEKLNKNYLDHQISRFVNSLTDDEYNKFSLLRYEAIASESLTTIDTKTIRVLTNVDENVETIFKTLFGPDLSSIKIYVLSTKKYDTKNKIQMDHKDFVEPKLFHGDITKTFIPEFLHSFHKIVLQDVNIDGNENQHVTNTLASYLIKSSRQSTTQQNEIKLIKGQKFDKNLDLNEENKALLDLDTHTYIRSKTDYNSFLDWKKMLMNTSQPYFYWLTGLKRNDIPSRIDKIIAILQQNKLPVVVSFTKLHRILYIISKMVFETANGTSSLNGAQIMALNHLTEHYLDRKTTNVQIDKLVCLTIVIGNVQYTDDDIQRQVQLYVTNRSSLYDKLKIDERVGANKRLLDLNTKFITNTNDAMVVNDMRDAEIEYFKLSSASASASASAPAPAPAPAPASAPPPPVKIPFDRDYQFDDDIITQDGLNFRFEKTRGLLFLMTHDVTFGEADKKPDVITDVDGYASYFHNISYDRLTRYLAKFNKILCDIDHWKFHNRKFREEVYRHKQKDLTYSILETLRSKLEGEKKKIY